MGGGKTALNKLLARLGLGLTGLVFFWALECISTNELAKSGVLMAAALPGIAGLFLVLPWLRERPRWFSRTAWPSSGCSSWMQPSRVPARLLRPAPQSHPGAASHLQHQPGREQRILPS
jgi:hypothetical protein